MELRLYKKEDAAEICKWLTSEEEFYRWSADRFNKYPPKENDIDGNYAPQIKTGRFFPMTAVDENGAPVGHFIIRYPREDDDDTVRFGFIIVAPDSRGKGYGSKMLRLGIGYVKENMTAKRIELGVFDNNDKAKLCYGAVGFKEYGRHKCEMPIGVWDCIDMALTIR